MLRQAKNDVNIEGILSEINLKYGSYVDKKTGRSVDTIGGDVKIRVNEMIGGEVVTMDIPVYMFSNKLKVNGDINPAFTSIENVMKNFVSIAAAGSEIGADKVYISHGNIRMNEYYGTNGNLNSYPRIYTSFLSKTNPSREFHPHASFELEFAISSMDYVTDKDGIELEPKKLRIKSIVPQYGGNVDTMELFATNPVVIDAITTYWEPNKTYTAKGRLNFTSTTVEEIEECDFGEPETKYHTITVSELIVTKGTQSPLDDEFAFPPAELAAALRERKARLEALKDKKRTKAAPAPTGSNAGYDLGF